MIPYQKIITIVVLITFVSVFLLFPTQAEARGFLKNLLRFLKRTTKFIVELPGKIADTLTRPLGPVLGPIAAEILLANTPNRILEIINKADKINTGISTLESQTQKLNDAKQVLRDRADEVYKEIESLYELDAEMKSQLLSGEITYDQYKGDFIALNQMIKAFENTADRLETAADNLKPENLLRQIAGDVLKAGERKIKNIIKSNVSKELERLFNPDLIKTFLGDGGMNITRVIDLIVASDASRILGDLGYDKSHPDFDALLETIKDEIKEQMKNDRDYLKDNWRDVVSDKIKQILEEYEVSKDQDKLDEFFDKYGNKNNNSSENVNASSDSDTSELDELLDYEDPEDNIAPDPSLPKDEHGCYPGYEWDVKVGICKQSNCNSVTDAHWSYTMYCVCGSSGSINENPNDPNKECHLRSDNASCPSCVYACVGVNAECPALPSN